MKNEYLENLSRRSAEASEAYEKSLVLGREIKSKHGEDSTQYNIWKKRSYDLLSKSIKPMGVSDAISCYNISKDQNDIVLFWKLYDSEIPEFLQTLETAGVDTFLVSDISMATIDEAMQVDRKQTSFSKILDDFKQENWHVTAVENIPFLPYDPERKIPVVRVVKR